MAELKIGARRFSLPRQRLLRIALGVLFVILGIFGFLPILGFWMIPVGLLILSHDIASVRRFRRRMTIRWGRRKREPSA
jgi:hypothetical protein